MRRQRAGRGGHAHLRRGALIALPVALLAAVVVALPVEAAPPRAAAELAPTVVVSPPSAPVGAPVTVALADWPPGVVTVAVCGDAARRGSADCDQITSHGVAVSAGGSASVRLTVSPPTPCPCVVRVSSPTSDLVRTAPLDVPGFGVLTPDELAPPLLASTASGRLEVSARLGEPRTGPTSLSAAFGGPVAKVLVLTVTNHGDTVATGVTLSAAVGHDRRAASPVPVPSIGDLGPGEQRSLSVPVTLPAFANGRYLVFGRVDSMVGGVGFEISTATVPWATWLLVAASAAVVLRALIRRRRSGVGPPTTTPEATATTAATLALLEQLSAIEDSWVALLSSASASDDPAGPERGVEVARDRGRPVGSRH